MLPSRRTFMHGLLAVPGTALLTRRPLPGLTATVYNGSELHAALRAAGPGSAITLAPGDYGDAGRFILPAGGVSVRAQSPLNTVLRDHLVVDGDEVEVEGLAFMEGLTLIGSGLKISGNKMSGKGIDVTGVNVEVSNCDIGNFSGHGITVRGTAKDAYIHDNYLHHGRGSAINVGTAMNTSDTRLGCRVERNRLESISGTTEALTVKSSGNAIRNNTLRNCPYLSIRHGESNTCSGNTIDHSYGIMVHDRNNQISGNRCVNMEKYKGIRVMAGDVSPSSTSQGHWPHAENTSVSGNSGLLVVGETWGRFKLPARGTQIGSHNGDIEFMNHTGTKGG